MRNAFALASLSVLVAGPVAAQDSDPFPGIHVAERIGDGQRLFVATVDLCAAGVSVRGARFEERRNTVPAWARDRGVQLAVNGNFFAPGDFDHLDGWHMGDGDRWGGDDHAYVAPIAFGPGRVDLWPHELEQGGWHPGWADQIISGHPTLVHEGQLIPNDFDNVLCTPRHPRTALGLTADLRTLILAVVDGRDGGRAVGMTCNELGAAMAFIGAHWAVNLDGGGSSTFYLQGRGVLNQPSDGSPRTVASFLGIYASGQGAPSHCHTPDPPCVDNPALSRCDGSVVEVCHNGKLDRGDCGVFGLTCEASTGQGRCADPRCAGGDTEFCADASIMARCRGGTFEVAGECGVFGATCGQDGGGVFCIHPFCGGLADRTDCTPDGLLATCARGQRTEAGCAAGLVCRPQAEGRAACVDPDAPPPVDAGLPPPPADAAGPPPPPLDAAPPTDDARVLAPDAEPGSPDLGGGPDGGSGRAEAGQPDVPEPDESDAALGAVDDGGELADGDRRAAGEVEHRGGCGVVPGGGTPWLALASLCALGRASRRRRARG